MGDILKRVNLGKIEAVEINVVQEMWKSSSASILPQTIVPIKSAVLQRDTAVQTGISFHEGYVELILSEHMIVRATSCKNWRGSRPDDSSSGASELDLLCHLLKDLAISSDTPAALYLFHLPEVSFDEFATAFPDKKLHVHYLQVAEQLQKRHLYNSLTDLSRKGSAFPHLQLIAFEGVDMHRPHPFSVVDSRFVHFFCKDWAETRNTSSYDLVVSDTGGHWKSRGKGCLISFDRMDETWKPKWPRLPPPASNPFNERSHSGPEPLDPSPEPEPEDWSD